MANNTERNKLIKDLSEHGFVYIRQKGSHRQFEHPVTHKKVTVPFIKKNIELSVKRQIKENERILNEKSVLIVAKCLKIKTSV